MQKHDAVRALFHSHAQVPDARQLLGQHGQLMVVRGKQSARLRLRMKELDCRPGEGKPVKSRRSAPHFIQQNQGPAGRRIQNRRRLRHLHHERRASSRNVVAGPDARINPVDEAKAQTLGRHKAAHLGKKNEHRRLAQISALAAHVRPGNEQQTRAIAGAIQINVVGNEPSFARLLHPLLDYRMARGHRLDHWGLVYDWPHIPPSRGQVGKVGQQIRLRHSRRRPLDSPRCLQYCSPQLDKNPLLNLDAPLMRRENLALIYF